MAVQLKTIIIKGKKREGGKQPTSKDIPYIETDLLARLQTGNVCR